MRKKISRLRDVKKWLHMIAEFKIILVLVYADITVTSAGNNGVRV